MGILKQLFGRPDRSVTLAALQRDLDLINESAAIMEKTSNPETFFSRYDFYMEKLALMAERESTGVRGVKFGGESFILKFKKMSSGKLRIETINNFIDRMWADTCQKAEKLKTDKGKQNRYQKFYSDLQQYEEKMPPECIQHYRSLSTSDVVPNHTASLSNADPALQPLRRSSPTDSIPQQERAYRVIPDYPKAMCETIPSHDLKSLQAEVEYLNRVVQSACELAYISCPLSLDTSKFAFGLSRHGTYYEWNPYTSSGKFAKYPLVLHYQSAVPKRSTEAHDTEYEAWLDFLDKGGTTEEWEKKYGKLKEYPVPITPDESFGEVYYLQNGLIGQARLIFWRDHVGYFIHLGQTKGALALKKVIQCKPPEEIILYKE